MDKIEAGKIGRRLGLICAAAGTVIAQLIMMMFFMADGDLMHALFWFADTDYKLNLLAGICILFGSAAWHGQWAAVAILMRQRNAWLMGVLCGVATLLTTAFLSGWLGFFQEGLDYALSSFDPYEDYLFKPFYWITYFGLIPAILMGLWLGFMIRLKGKRLRVVNDSPARR